MVVATKVDATTDHTRLYALRAFCREKNFEFHAISAATGEGVKELVRSMADALDKIPRAVPDSESHDDLHLVPMQEPTLPLVSGEDES
jgi:GTPase Era involved in 16S rRNA processing